MIDQISFMHHWIFCLLLERDKQWAGDDQQSLDQNDTLLAVNMTCQHTHKAVKEQLVVCQCNGHYNRMPDLGKMWDVVERVGLNRVC